MGTNGGILGTCRTTGKRLALLILTPFALPGDFPRGCGGEQGCPTVATICSSRDALVATVGSRWQFSHGCEPCSCEVASSYQQVRSDGDNPTPALKLRWSANPNVSPKQGLLVKTIAMLLAKTMDRGLSNGHQICVGVSNPDKPTDAWVAFGVCRSGPFDPDHTSCQPVRIFESHLLPETDPDRRASRIERFAFPIGIKLGRWISGLQLLPTFAGRSPLACWWRRGSIK